ncbi:MAG: hypothetical protein DLM57_01860 [Pseudonocardiales bacterium]|nr:MAG: hypothetical protein DLM57_01860 [Pseudonocardiales bacterium]
MMVLGILLLAAAVVVAVELVLANHAHDSEINVHMWRWTWHFDALWLAVLGAAILVVAVLGLAMMRAGGRRARRLRRERRELAAENRRLAERADVAESAVPGPGYGPVDVAEPGPSAPGPSAPGPSAPVRGYGPPVGPATQHPRAAQPEPGEYPAPAEEPHARERVEGRPLEP